MSSHFAVETDQLAKRYGDVRALDGVSLQVGAGEIFGLLGPNGAGKSTLIRILTGRARPTGGEARVLGHAMPRELEAVRRSINLVAETPNVYQRGTARENLVLFCELYGLPRSRADEALELVRLTEVAGRKVKTFSTGMRQRLLLARAVLNEPRVLFLDEPTRGLDPRSARDLRDIVRGLAEGGSTVFLTTHDMHEAEELCGRIAFIVAGRVAALGTPAELKSSPARGREVDVTLESGEVERLSLDSGEGPRRLQELTGSGRVRSLHSLEPTLDDVFIELTGTSLDADPAAGERAA